MGLDAIVCVGVGDGGLVAEVAHRLAGLDSASEEDGVLSLGGAESELVECDALATSLGDAGSGRLGESHGGDGELGDLEQAGVVCDSSDDDGNLAILALHESSQSGEGNWGSVDF